MNDNNQSGGIGICTLLTVLFVGLKLTDNIDWSWIWILSPMWLPAAVLLVIILVVMSLSKIFE